MKTLVVIVLAVVLSGCTTKQLYYSSIPLTVGDWAQTRNNDEDWPELNLILGDNPSSSSINIYFAGWMVFNAAVYNIAPEGLAKPYFYIFNAIQILTISNNLRHGVGFKF